MAQQLLLRAGWLSQARDWALQLQLRLTIDPVSLATQACILFTVLAAVGYIVHLHRALRQEQRGRKAAEQGGRQQQRWASLAAALLDADVHNV